ncbi:MAG TPA: cell division protein FtsK, partial [Sulfuricurvum kujiense]
MLRDTLFIAGFGILFYLGIATIIADASIIGAYGATFALSNVYIFGYVAYTYLLLLMVPLFYWYKYDGGVHRRLEMSGIFALLFLALLFFQAMVVEGSYRGALIGAVVDFLSIYIGAFGLWILWLMMVTVSVVLVMEQSLSEL